MCCRRVTAFEAPIRQPFHCSRFSEIDGSQIQSFSNARGNWTVTIEQSVQRRAIFAFSFGPRSLASGCLDLGAEQKKDVSIPAKQLRIVQIGRA
jgi:hypothetical protein